MIITIIISSLIWRQSQTMPCQPWFRVCERTSLAFLQCSHSHTSVSWWLLAPLLLLGNYVLRFPKMPENRASASLKTSQKVLSDAPPCFRTIFWVEREKCLKMMCEWQVTHGNVYYRNPCLDKMLMPCLPASLMLLICTMVIISSLFLVNLPPSVW